MSGKPSFTPYLLQDYQVLWLSACRTAPDFLSLWCFYKTLRTRQMGLSPAGQACGLSGCRHHPCGICVAHHVPTVSGLLHLHQIMWLMNQISFDHVTISLPQDEDDASLSHTIAGAILSTSLSAAQRQLEGALLTPKLPFSSLACMFVTAHRHLPSVISHDVQQRSLSKKTTTKLLLYLVYHHWVILSQRSGSALDSFYASYEWLLLWLFGL